MGVLNVVARVDQTFDLIGDMAEMASKVSANTVTEDKMRSLLTDPANVCIAGYREGSENTPRDLEGFIIADHQANRSRRIVVISLVEPDNIPLLRILLDHLRDYSPHGVSIIVDAKARSVFQTLGFIVTKRVGSRYEMLRRFQ
jgi:hypothetical protein